MTPKTDSVAVLRAAIYALEYAAFNLDGSKLADLPPGIVDSTGASTTALIAARDLRAHVAALSAPGGVGDAVTELCPACERDGAIQTLYTETVHLEAHLPVRVIGLEGLYCPHCGETTIAFDQAKRNDERFKVARAAALAAHGTGGK